MKRTISWDRDEQKDCFGNVGEPTIKIIWPEEKNGAIINENKMLLSQSSIEAIGTDTKGTVNGVRFSITKQFVLGGKIYGNMKVQFDKYNGWFEVLKMVQK